MNGNRIKEDQLRTILKQDGMETPSDLFSDRLTSLIVETYQQEQTVVPHTPESVMARWLGRVITGMLIAIVLWSLSVLYPIQINVVVLSSLLALLTGIGILIQMAKKILLLKISQD